MLASKQSDLSPKQLNFNFSILRPLSEEYSIVQHLLRILTKYKLYQS